MLENNDIRYYVFVLVVFSMTLLTSLAILGYDIAPLSRLFPFTGRASQYITQRGGWDVADSNEDGVKRCGETIEFKDYHYDVEKSNGTFRILCLGDSYTYGYGVGLNETWPKKLENSMKALNQSFEVINFGMIGTGTKDQVEIFRECGREYDPDLVILQFLHEDFVEEGVLDTMQDSFYSEYESGERTLPKQIENLGLSERDLKLFFRVESYNIISDNCDSDRDACFEPIRDSVLELNGMSKRLMIMTIIDPPMNRNKGFDERLQNLSIGNNISFYDFRIVMREHYDEDIFLPDNHYNGKGYELLSNVLMETLLRDGYLDQSN